MYCVLANGGTDATNYLAGFHALRRTSNFGEGKVTVLAVSDLSKLLDPVELFFSGTMLKRVNCDKFSEARAL